MPREAEAALSEWQSDAYCRACGCYAPLSLDGNRRVHGCDRTPPADGLPATIYACPICAGHGACAWGCWGTEERPHEHAYMRPIHEIVREWKALSS